LVGMLEGVAEGDGEGIREGLTVGLRVAGKRVGEIVGDGVGPHVSHLISIHEFSPAESPTVKTSHIESSIGGVFNHFSELGT